MAPKRARTDFTIADKNWLLDYAARNPSCNQNELAKVLAEHVVENSRKRYWDCGGNSNGSCSAIMRFCTDEVTDIAVHNGNSV